MLGKETPPQFANAAHGIHPLHVYEASTGQLIRRVKIPYTVSASDATVTPDGKRLIAVADRSLYVWDLESGKLVEEKAFADRVSRIHLLPDGKSFLIASGNRFFRGRIGAEQPEAEKTHFQSYLLSRLSPDGKLLALADGSGKLEIWNASANQKIHTLSNSWERPTSSFVKSPPYRMMAFSPDGARLTADRSRVSES